MLTTDFCWIVKVNKCLRLCTKQRISYLKQFLKIYISCLRQLNRVSLTNLYHEVAVSNRRVIQAWWPRKIWLSGNRRLSATLYRAIKVEPHLLFPWFIQKLLKSTIVRERFMKKHYLYKIRLDCLINSLFLTPELTGCIFKDLVVIICKSKILVLSCRFSMHFDFLRKRKK